MPDYTRLVSYIYNYEEGIKRNNVGYARVEARNGQCKCTLHITAPSLNAKQLKAYIFKRRDDGIKGILLGTLEIRNGIGEYKTQTDSTHIMNTPYSIIEMGGIILYLSDKKYFATEWDDKPITMGMVSTIEENLDETEKLSVAEQKEEKIIETSKPKETQAIDLKDKINEENIMKYDIKVSSITDSITETNIAEGNPIEGNLTEGNLTEDNLSEAKLTEGNLSEAKLTEANLTEANLTEDNIIEDNLTEVNIPEKKVDSEKDYHANSLYDWENLDSRNAFEEREESTYREERDRGNLDDTVDPEYSKDLEYSEEPEYREDFDNIDESEEIIDRGYLNEQAGMGSPCDKADQKDKAGYAKSIFEDHPLAKRICNSFPRMYPFEDNDIAWCVKIEPQDIGLFPMESWLLGNNSFLLHGYYSYRHLIFARINDKNGINYILGVPGTYHNREKFMAKMFGFENFKCVKRKELRTGEFGYWYIPIILK